MRTSRMMTTTPIIANLSRRKRRQISPHSERCSMSSASGLHMPAAPTAEPISEAPDVVEPSPRSISVSGSRPWILLPRPGPSGGT